MPDRERVWTGKVSEVIQFGRRQLVRVEGISGCYQVPPAITLHIGDRVDFRHIPPRDEDEHPLNILLGLSKAQ